MNASSNLPVDESKAVRFAGIGKLALAIVVVLATLDTCSSGGPDQFDRNALNEPSDGFAQPDTLNGYWLLSDYVISSTGGSFPMATTYWNYTKVYTFDDGTASTDIDTILTQGVESSRQANPDKWHNYTVLDDGQLALSNDLSSDDYKSPKFTTRGEPGESGMVLNGCWEKSATVGSTSSTAFDGVSTGTQSVGVSSYRVCFDDNGRYTSDHSTASSSVASNSEGSASSKDADQGTYRIDGFLVRFDHDDGAHSVRQFAWYRDEDSDKRVKILLSGRSYDPV